jgi:peptide/nickel transport system substrate-binding protein
MVPERPAHAAHSKRLLVALLASLLAICLACGGVSLGGPRGSLVIAVIGEPSTLDGRTVDEPVAELLMGSVFETLLEYDRTGRLVPMLAERVEQLDPDTWQLELRQGVSFHNGEPFDAQAAVDSLYRASGWSWPRQRVPLVDGLEAAEAVEPYKLRIRAPGFGGLLPLQLTQVPMLPPKAAAAASFGRKPIGSGPYLVEAWEPMRELRLAAYSGSWSGPPGVERVTIRLNQSSSDQFAGLRAGRVDLALDLDQLQASQAPQPIDGPAVIFSSLQLNTNRPPLDDPRVRQALNLAIDRRALAEALYPGHASPAGAQRLIEDALGFDPRSAPYPTDRERASALLDAAGYDRAQLLTIHIPAERYPNVQRLAELIADQLRLVGVKTRLEFLNWADYRVARLFKGLDKGTPAMRLNWLASALPDAGQHYARLACSGELSWYCDPDLEPLLREAVATNDPAIRAERYRALLPLLERSPDAVYLLRHRQLFGASSRLRWQPGPDGRVRPTDLRLAD